MDRRNFLKRSSIGTLVGLMDPRGTVSASVGAGDESGAERRDALRCGVIGFGPWGREICAAIEDVEELQLAAICDNYSVMLRRAQRAHPDARREEDYRAILEDDSIPAVIVATPTHLHRQIVLDALSAGKHVYCEAPMAHTIEDARIIAEAAVSRPDQIFQVGLHLRTEPQYRSVFQFIRSGALGRPLFGRAQYHVKDSWRRSSASREREIEQNWRLDSEVSLGLVGEAGTQQLDAANWVFGDRPIAVTGFGSTLLWNDGRDMPDSVTAVLEYPGGERLTWEGTLGNSFDSTYEIFHGNDSTIMLRDQKAWMFKETDAPMLGWEVYARKDKWYKETGIALIANATKIDAQSQDPTYDDPNMKSPLWHALKAYADNFNFGPFPAVADANLGYVNVVLAAAAREAIRTKSRVEIDPASYQL